MPLRYTYRKVRDFFVYRVLHVDDTPHRIALSVAIAIFVTWTPTIGLQMILTVLLCWLLRANKVVGVPFVWISNPLTIVPIYYPNYVVGCWLLGGEYGDFNFIEAVSAKLDVGWLDQIRIWLLATWHVFWPLWAGSLLVGAILGAITYPIVYWSVIKYRRLKQVLVEHLAHRHEAHAEPALADGPHPSAPKQRRETSGENDNEGAPSAPPSPSDGMRGPNDTPDSDGAANAEDTTNPDDNTSSEDSTESNSTPGQRPGL